MTRKGKVQSNIETQLSRLPQKDKKELGSLRNEDGNSNDNATKQWV